MKIIPVQPTVDDASDTNDSHRPSASRRTFGRKIPPSRRTFGFRGPSRRTFGFKFPSRRSFSHRGF